jgi:hypothetical protein
MVCVEVEVTANATRYIAELDRGEDSTCRQGIAHLQDTFVYDLAERGTAECCRGEGIDIGGVGITADVGPPGHYCLIDSVTSTDL